jgi:hypothetical protein
MTSCHHELVSHEASAHLVGEKVNCGACEGATSPSSQDPWGARTQAVDEEVMCVQIYVYVLSLDRIWLEKESKGKIEQNSKNFSILLFYYFF